MSAFGKSEEAGSSVVKLHTGAVNFKIVAINPNKEELEAIYGRELNFTPEYIGETEVTDADGVRTVPQIRLDFLVENEDKSITTKVQFYVANTHQKSATGKFKVINSFGKDAWLEQASIQSGTAPDNMQWFNTDGIKVAKKGEVELISFLVNLLNLPFDPAKLSDVSKAYARIDKDEWVKIFAGDVSLLRGIVAGTNNKVGVLLGVKTKGDSKLVQAAYNRHTLRQYSISSTKANKFQYLLKALDASKAAGAFGNVEFGNRDCVVREFDLDSSVIDSLPNAEDVFATAAPTPVAAGGDDTDWLTGQ
jgi:hypothetical protein